MKTTKTNNSLALQIFVHCPALCYDATIGISQYRTNVSMRHWMVGDLKKSYLTGNQGEMFVFFIGNQSKLEIE